MIEMKLPQLGESLAECVITTWLKQVGEQVVTNEPLLEVTTDKVTVEIPSDHNGVVKEIIAREGDLVTPNAVLCKLEVEVG